MIKSISLIVIHCSATRENVDYSPERLEQDHKARGYLRANYDFYIRKSGEVVRMNPLGFVPAQAMGYDKDSLGICYEGGLDIFGRAWDTRTPAQKISLKQLLRHLLIRFPEACICGHRDLSRYLAGDGIFSSEAWGKLCPSFDAEKEYMGLVHEVGWK